MAKKLELGLFSMNSGVCSDPEAMVATARVAEECGFDSIWLGEHVVLPDPQAPPSPMAPTDPILDPLIALAFAAAHTTRLLLATGIIILPQRNPVVLAKQLASLDVLSHGRLVVGVGAGYLEPETTAIGVPMAGRGERTVEYIQAMRALWTMDKPAYTGRYAQFSGVDAFPRPVQPGGPRIIMGGHTPPAYKRTIEHADGWYGFMLTAEQTAVHLDGLRRTAAELGRDPAVVGELDISVTPRGRPSREMYDSFAELGVTRLVLTPSPRYSLDELADFVRAAAQAGGLR